MSAWHARPPGRVPASQRLLPKRHSQVLLSGGTTGREVCAGRPRCHRRAGCTADWYGRIVQIPLARHDRRIFTPIPHGSPSWRRGYRRAALERIYGRVERDFVRGRARMQTRIGLTVAVKMAGALDHIRAGRPRLTRPLVQPFAGTG